MANHPSAKKRIRQNESKQLRNKYYAKTTRNAIKMLRNTQGKKEAEEIYSRVASMIDRLAKQRVIHHNKAANLKSKLARHINSL
jgi:small subunit ribosomal protein S20